MASRKKKHKKAVQLVPPMGAPVNLRPAGPHINQPKIKNDREIKKALRRCDEDNDRY